MSDETHHATAGSTEKLRNTVKCSYSFIFLLYIFPYKFLVFLLPISKWFPASHMPLQPPWNLSPHLLLSFLCGSFSAWPICSLLSISAILQNQLGPIQSSCQCNCPFCNQFNDSPSCHLKHFCPFPGLYVLTSSYTSSSLTVVPHLSPDLSPPPQCRLQPFHYPASSPSATPPGKDKAGDVSHCSRGE